VRVEDWSVTAFDKHIDSGSSGQQRGSVVHGVHLGTRERTLIKSNQFIEQQDRSATYIDTREYR